MQKPPMALPVRGGRRCAAWLGLWVLAALLPPTAFGQAAPDARWQPWLGCWTPVAAAEPMGFSIDAPSPQVCVVPAAGPAAVDVVTFAGERLLFREHIEADGARHTSTRDGCSGWETAEWSNDGQRVYLASEFTCPSGGLTRRTSGLMATTASGEWLQLVGVTVKENTGVRVLRHRDRIPEHSQVGFQDHPPGALVVHHQHS